MPSSKDALTPDLAWAIRIAFLAGQESPYDLKTQEVDRIYDLLIDRIASRAVSIQKTTQEAEDSSRKLNVDNVCPQCGMEGTLVERKFENGIHGITSTIMCSHCSWQGTFMDMIRHLKSIYQ